MNITNEQIEKAAAEMDVSFEDLKTFLDTGESVSFARGEYLFHESSPRRWFAIVLEGVVDLTRGLSGKVTRVAALKEGAIIGEGLFVNDESHSVSGLAREDVTLWTITKDKLSAYKDSHPASYYKLIARTAQRVSDRLRTTTAQLEKINPEAAEATGFRKEHDSLGEREVSNSVYYGVQTMRAMENFPFSGIKVSHFKHFVDAFAYVKKAAAFANAECGVLEQDVADAIMKACDRILDGEFHENFNVDMFQGGAGTSTNMCANEVIANVALEILGHAKGEYEIVHPNDHVNRSQSTNDAYPTAIKLALLFSLKETVSGLGELKKSLNKKAEEFADVLKMGRTENQDAVPMTIGQEFSSYAVMVSDGIRRLERASEELISLNMGATAIGTGLNSPKGYADLCTKKIAEYTGLPVTLADNLVEATQDAACFADMSSALKTSAVQISKICNDLRWASSGPRCGLNEINLPPLQPGSSIMPGKVNPVAPEVVNQICYHIIGSDTTVSMAAEASEFELNMAEPIMAYHILTSLMLFKNAAIMLSNRCIQGITANKERCEEMVKNSIGIVTALNPTLGYEKSASIAKEALKTGGSVYDLVLEKGWLKKEELDDILSPQKMANPLAHE